MADLRRRIIHIAHSGTGRLRLRLGWLRGAPQEAPALADHLASLNGMIEAAVRPWTGSVLCQYDPETLEEAHILAAVRRHTRVTVTLRPGEEPPPQALERPQPSVPNSSLARAVAQSFAAINEEVLAATAGRLDLGILTSLGFMTAGAAEIAMTQTIPAPPWFNLAWWAVRTFTTFERDTSTPTAAPPAASRAQRPALQAVPRQRPPKRQRPPSRLRSPKMR